MVVIADPSSKIPKLKKSMQIEFKSDNNNDNNSIHMFTTNHKNNIHIFKNRLNNNMNKYKTYIIFILLNKYRKLFI